MTEIPVDCLQPLYLHMWKKKWAKQVQSTWGWGVTFANKVSKKNIEAVDIVKKNVTYCAPPPVIALLLTAPPFE